MRYDDVFLCSLSSAQDPSLGSFGSVSPESSNKIFRFNDDVAPSDAAAFAVRKSLSQCGLSIGDIDLFISCSHTPDLNNPSLANSTLAKLEKVGIPGLEFRQSANGSFAAIDFAARHVALGRANCVVVSACEFLSRYFRDLNSDALKVPSIKEAFDISGDGAASCLIVSRKMIEKMDQTSQKSFSISAIKFASSAKNIESFTTPKPSSSQFPQRLTKEDVQAGNHVPHLEKNCFQTACKEVLKPVLIEFIRELGAKKEKITDIIIHSVAPDLSTALSLSENFPGVKVYESTAQSFYIGASGALTALNSLVEKGYQNLSSVLLITAGSGPSYSFAVLNAERAI